MRHVRAGRAAADPAPAQWHRGLTLLATISLFIGTRTLWTTAMHRHPPVAGVISLCYAAILVCGVLALAVRGRRALARVDGLVLAVAITLVVCGYWLDHAGSDEGVLTAQAALQILHGRPVYGDPWPWLFGTPRVGLTKTMAGGGDFTYGYPPLTAMIAAPVRLVIHSTAAATLVTSAALIIGTLVLWRLLPVPWRSAATAVCLGFGMLPAYARLGYPAVLALALLVPVVVRWPATGAGGRLGRYGVLRAVCLGAACAAQQLAWFLAPFLLIGVYAVRRGDMAGHGDPAPDAREADGDRARLRTPGRRALAVTARYAGVAALTWAVLNAYVAALGPRAWASGLLLPISQGAILHGQGLMGISYYFTPGSSRLDFYSYATLLLLLGLLAALVLFARRLGPALTVLPWLPFYLSTRSQDGYYLLMTPLWLAAAATVPASALAGAWQPRLPLGRRAKAACGAGLLLPAAACAAIAAASPAPLRMTVTARFTDTPRHGITSAAVRVVNTTGTTLTPHFASRAAQSASGWWAITSGPASIGPHASATYELTPPHGFRRVARGGHTLHMIAVTGKPMTITTALVPDPAAAGR
ncbi:hypothetical protein JFN87_08345 [Streptomyces bomunensis]|uniref:Uncharacterized protein n=1 Tax=Streptomyces montanisoli TaxID=2798581 RepID=A0A940RUR7_9ACTN|nr:hypothetical protein [Streptomyces montanisoli]MBP0457506.1 hypothetical protein [Streptomyces montanisoli]